MCAYEERESELPPCVSSRPARDCLAGPSRDVRASQVNAACQASPSPLTGLLAGGMIRMPARSAPPQMCGMQPILRPAKTAGMSNMCIASQSPRGS